MEKAKREIRKMEWSKVERDEDGKVSLGKSEIQPTEEERYHAFRKEYFDLCEKHGLCIDYKIEGNFESGYETGLYVVDIKNLSYPQKGF